MSDRLQTDSSPVPDGLTCADRDSRIEQLLLEGLDHYFAGEFDRAINVWTRVLFLDRAHARAKAYIERARGALGERQRESEELLHRGVDAFNRGDAEGARRLFTSAVERGGPHDVAQSFLDRLTRLDRPPLLPGEVRGRAPVAPRPPRAPSGGERRRSVLLPLLIVTVIGLGLVYLLASRERLAPFLFFFNWWNQDARASVRVIDAPLVVPRAAEIDLERAKTLLSAGHARDALRMVERIGPADPLRAEAARLRGEIQRALLAEIQGGGIETPPQTGRAPLPQPGRDQ